MDSLILDKIKHLIYEKDLQVSIHDISHQFEVHISEAIRILNQFADEHEGLHQNYLITWNESGSTDSLTLRRFLIVSEKDDLDFYKKSHENLNYHVYSVSKQKTNHGLVFEKFLFNPKKVDFNQIQRFSYISNDQVNLRKLKRDLIFNESDYTDTVMVEKCSSVNNKVDSPKRRNNTHNQYDQQKHKKMKTYENSNGFDQNENEEEFVTTNVKMESPENSFDSVKNDDEKRHDSRNKKSVLKLKKQSQTSIMSFFKKTHK